VSKQFTIHGPGQHLLEARNRIQAEFDCANLAGLEEAFGRIVGPFVHVLTYVEDHGDRSSTDPLFDAAALCMSAMHLLVSAAQMARQKADRETFILLRAALETGCVAYSVVAEPECFDEYCAARFDSTRAVTLSKRLVPEIGRVWGELSRLAVHVSRPTYGPNSGVDKNGEYSESIRLGLDRDAVFEDKLLLAGICLVASITTQIAQAIFYGPSDSKDRAMSKGGKIVNRNASLATKWVSEDLNEFWTQLASDQPSRRR
jgi:hypothetical protein